jgi:hypothetical protein
MSCRQNDMAGRVAGGLPRPAVTHLRHALQSRTDSNTSLTAQHGCIEAVQTNATCFITWKISLAAAAGRGQRAPHPTGQQHTAAIGSTHFKAKRVTPAAHSAMSDAVSESGAIRRSWCVEDAGLAIRSGIVHLLAGLSQVRKAQANLEKLERRRQDRPGSSNRAMPFPNLLTLPANTCSAYTQLINYGHSSRLMLHVQHSALRLQKPVFNTAV